MTGWVVEMERWRERGRDGEGGRGSKGRGGMEERVLVYGYTQASVGQLH